jgi:uncharacterized protein YndB with AHSA1/START domain
MKISFSIDVNSTPATVFGWLERPEKAVKWMTSVTKTEILHETSERIGTTFREVVEEDGNGVELQGVITDFKPGKLISFHLDSRVNIVDVEYCVEAIQNGTRLTQNANVQWKFPVNVISIFIGEKIRQKISVQSQKEFEKLKELCESGVEE